ncbi:MAG: chromosomal replication initiator protein DnaA [Candidatus Saccharibacteria bacterium]|nr:chromosomal replication initiator protein DnaA [Candidatus Saccharibacteria bacterium]
MPNEWQTVLDEIKKNVTEMAFNTFLVNIKFVSYENNIVTFSVHNSFIKPNIEKKYKSQVLKALNTAGYICDDFNIIVDDQAAKKTVIRRPVETTPVPAPVSVHTGSYQPASVGSIANGFVSTLTSNTGLSSKYLLDNYVVGGSNDMAVSAARAIIEHPGTSYNPFFIYGGSGYGKTHLIQAIGNEIHKLHPEMNILYVTIEQFYGDFVYSLQKKKLDDFKNKYRNLDVLIVDDFQFIQGKAESQNEFFHTFNELYANNKQVIVAADRLPSQIATVDPRLASRLTQGISFDIQLPDFETRCAIIHTKAEMLGQMLDNVTVEFLAENFGTNIRDLEGELNRILLLADVRGVPTSDIIKDITPVSQPTQHRITPKQLIERVAKYYGLTSKDLLGTSRVKDIKNARQIAMYLMNEELGLSTVKIGNEFSKDHTTIMHGVKIIKTNLKSDFNLREQVSELRGKIYAN